MHKKLFITALLLVSFTALVAQTQKKVLSPKDQVKKDIAFLEDFNPIEYMEKDMDFDPDEFCQKAAENLVKYLKTDASENANPTEVGLKEPLKSDDSRKIKIYNFGYHSGGSRGWVSHPVVQWTNNLGKPAAFNLSAEINSSFTELYPLDKDLYLLIGYERLMGACEHSVAYVVKIDNNNLVLNYPAFGTGNQLSFCDVEYDYDATSKTLSGKIDDPSGYENAETLKAFGNLISFNKNTGKFKVRFQNGKFSKVN